MTAKNQSKAKQVWGKRAHEFYADLKNAPVSLMMSTGQALSGVLVGVDVYDLILLQEDGGEILVGKGQIVCARRAR